MRTHSLRQSPLTDPSDVSGGVDLTLVRVGFQCYGDVAIVISGPEPDVTSIFEAGPDRNARLIDSVTFNYAVTSLDTQRMFFPSVLIFAVAGKRTCCPNER